MVDITEVVNINSLNMSDLKMAKLPEYQGVHKYLLDSRVVQEFINHQDKEE